MNKKILYSVMTVLIMVFGVTSSYAADNNVKNNANPVKTSVEAERPAMPHNVRPPRGEGFHKGTPPMLTKEEMEAKKAEYEKRLNLTDEQKKQIEKNRKKDIEKIKPVMDKIHQYRQDLREIDQNETLSDIEKQKQKNEIKKEIRKLKNKADKYRIENMQNFENILTEEQKLEFQKIKEEQKKSMEEHFKNFQKAKAQGSKKVPAEK